MLIHLLRNKTNNFQGTRLKEFPTKRIGFVSMRGFPMASDTIEISCLVYSNLTTKNYFLKLVKIPLQTSDIFFVQKFE